MGEHVPPITASLQHVVRGPKVMGPGPHPLLVLLHGRGADEYDLLPLADHLDSRFFVVSARAPYPFPNGGAAWYHLQQIGTPDAASFTQSLDLLQRFLGEVVAGYPADPRRVYLLGFSQGAVMSLGLILAQPKLVDAAVALSGYVPPGMDETSRPGGLKGRGVFIGHGMYDDVIPVELGRQAQGTLAGTGADVVYREYAMGHQITLDELQDVATWVRERLERPRDEEIAVP